MELIKQIKQAEAQAQEIVEQAKASAAKRALDGSEKRQKALTEAEQKRKKTVETAISAAQAQGLAEAEVLKKQAQKQHQQLREKAAGKMPMAATKVINHLKG